MLTKVLAGIIAALCITNALTLISLRSARADVVIEQGKVSEANKATTQAVSAHVQDREAWARDKAELETANTAISDTLDSCLTYMRTTDADKRRLQGIVLELEESERARERQRQREHEVMNNECKVWASTPVCDGADRILRKGSDEGASGAGGSSSGATGRSNDVQRSNPKRTAPRADRKRAAPGLALRSPPLHRAAGDVARGCARGEWSPQLPHSCIA
jgi:hypothetical protein